MSLNGEGYQFWRDGQELAMLFIVNREDDGTTYHATYYNPTTDEIRKAVEEFEMPADVVLELVRNKDPYVHTLFIDVQKFMEGLRGDVEEGTD